MWYNVSIMKKYCLIIIAAVASALIFCGCEKKSRVAEYVDMDNSPLTVVTTVTETPADTYSEYMETYTPSETTGTDVYYYQLPPDGNHIGGHAFSIDIPEMDKPKMDKPQFETAMRPDKAVRPYTSSVTTAVPEETDEGEETVTATPTYTVQRPETDAVHIQTAPRDTAPTRFVPETTTESLASSAE